MSDMLILSIIAYFDEKVNICYNEYNTNNREDGRYVCLTGVENRYLKFSRKGIFHGNY